MKLLSTLSLTLIVTMSFSQAKMRRLSNSINNPSINVFAPYISFDGQLLLFTSDYADDGTLIYYSQRETGDWKAPVELPKHLNSRLNLLKSYTLSPDGKTIYITSIKGGGVGGFDMWSSDFKGGWGELKNLFAPLNSKMHDGSPTFTTDGSVIYFMRCEKMDFQKADKCKIFMSRKKNTGQWEEPVELPSSINAGNSQTPRIMADGETLIFSSDKHTPNKGKMDLYVTKYKNGEWSSPIPIETVNTEKDDQYVCAQANGRYLLKEAPGKFRSEIIEYLLPDDIRPRGVMRIDGVIKDASGASTPAYVSVTDINNNKRIFSGRPAADGSFFFYITEGSSYELSVDPESSSYTYYSKVYDLSSASQIRNDIIAITLKPIASGDELVLEALRFNPFSSTLTPGSASELRRLSRLIKSTPHLLYEIQVLLSGYLEDTSNSDPDLTESSVDSSYVAFEDIDSLGQLITRDSLVVKVAYNNDRTEKQANTIVEQLVLLGIDKNNLRIFFNAKPEEVAENRKTTVRLVAREKR